VRVFPLFIRQLLLGHLVWSPDTALTIVQTGEMAVRYNSDGSIAQKSKPREVREFNGIKYIMEEAIRGDYAFVKAYKADKHGIHPSIILTSGNCIFRLTANNFNGAMARNARVTIVEAEHIVEPGELDPAAIHVPGIYVDRVVQSTEEKKIEKYTFAKDPEEQLQSVGGGGEALARREKIVKRAAKEFKNGMYANLGIGMPMLAPNFLPEGVSVTLQSGNLFLSGVNVENGILGLGPYPKKGQEDPDLINAGKETVTLSPGAAVFGSEESFGMIRSGKINLTILGAMQVNQYGDLANWFLPGKVKGMGGAMDLVSQPHRTKVVVTMEHVDKKGRPKIVKECAFPLTGFRCVSRIITDLAVFDVDHDKGLTLIEKSKDTTVDDIKSKTGVEFEVASDLKDMED
jgi:3-oxoacid CoA-transferase